MTGTSAFTELSGLGILERTMLEQTIDTAWQLLAARAIGTLDRTELEGLFRRQIAELGTFLPSGNTEQIILGFTCLLPPLSSLIMTDRYWEHFHEAVDCICATHSGGSYDKQRIDALLNELLLLGLDLEAWANRAILYAEWLALPLRRLRGWDGGDNRLPRV